MQMIVIEDRPLTLDSLTRDIPWVENGIEVVGAFASAEEALLFLQNHPVDIMLSDIVLPGENGIELCREVLGWFPGVMVILISAHSKFEYAREGLRLGAFDYIEKPVDHRHLLDVVLAAAECRRQQRYIHSLVQESIPLLIERLFHRLLTGQYRADHEELSEEANLLDVPLNQGPYMCATLGPGANELSVDDRHRWCGQWMELGVLVRQSFPAAQIFGPYEMRSDVMCLILGSNDPAMSTQLRALLDAFAQRQPGIPFTAGIGNAQADIVNIDKSYEYALSKMGEQTQQATLHDRAIQGGIQSPIIQKAQQYIQGNFPDKLLDLGKVAGHVSMSPSYFSTLFKRATGVGVAMYINNQRMEFARDMLEHSELRVFEISDQAGFASPYYFSISFKRQFGVSPVTYRKSRFSQMRW